MPKMLKQLPEYLYGQSDACIGEVDINIEYIWNISKNEDEFIRLFAQTYAHEIIHILVESIVIDIFVCGEERMIRKTLIEDWDKKLSKYYTCRAFKKI
ncbi:hypothetical protein J4457_04285 [Candidatus Woesearchaeota archaeon]|nr:hypothetical protein [Candidatus Woesearchaeota archaeon]